MGDQRNYAALDWVLGEIEETLSEARQALEAYVENPKDATQLRFCVTHIHQVRGSLQIVEFHGASLLAEEMENLAQAIMEKQVSSSRDALEVLMRSLLQLPIYLDHVKVYRDDTARSVLPLLNDIRAVRKESYLSESELFSPDLSVLENLTGVRHPLLDDTEKLKQVTAKLREMYQFAAASVLRNIKVRENLGYLEKVFARLVVITAGTRSGHLWKISSALIHALQREEVVLSVAVQGLLRHLARELRLLSERAPMSLDAAPPKGLVKNVLYYVALADSDSEVVKQVQAEYHLKHSDVAEGEENVDGYNVSSLDPDAVRSVVIALREELKSIKSNMDTVLSSRLAPSELVEILPIVKRVGDTLAVLGIAELRQKMIEEADVLAELSRRNGLDEAALVKSASNIIEVDSKLEAISKAVDRHRDIANINERKIEIDEAKRAVLRECQVGLEKAKEAIIEYISSQWDVERLENIDVLLNDIRGGLEMIPLPRAGAVIESCSAFIVTKLADDDYEPQWDTLESLADAMASVEYYLERLTNDMSEDADSLLDIAEQSVSDIGFSVGGQRAPVVQQAKTESANPSVSDISLAAVSDDTPSDSKKQESATIVPSSFAAGGDDESAIDDEIIEVFIDEAEEVQGTLKEYVPKWMSAPENEDSLVVVRRAYHTLKGSGRMVEAMEIGELAWAVENMLNRVIDTTIDYQVQHGQLVQAVTSILPPMVEAFRTRQPNPVAEQTALYSQWAFALAEGRIPEGFDAQFQDVVADEEESEVSSAVEQLGTDVDLLLSSEDDVEDSALLEIFSSEVETHLATIRAFIADMDAAAPIYSPPTDDLQRALHTLKGSAKMAQVDDIASMYEVLESFAKEMVTFQVFVTEDILQLVRDSVDYSQISLEQIKNRELVQIPKLDQFLARTAELRELSVGHLVRMKELQKDGENPVDPRLLSIFMAEEMKLLLDADEIVERWCRDPAGEERIPALMSELKTLAAGAEQAKLPDMAKVSVLLEDIYHVLLGDLAKIDHRTADQLKTGHEVLLDMVDAVAAGQNVKPPEPEYLAGLQAYLLSIREPLSEEQFADSQEGVQGAGDALELSDTEGYGVEEVTGGVPSPKADVSDEAAGESDSDTDALSSEGMDLAEIPLNAGFDEAAEQIDISDEETATAEPINDEPDSTENEALSTVDDLDSGASFGDQEVFTQKAPFEAVGSPEDEPAPVPVEQPAAVLLDSIDKDAEDFDEDILDVFLEEADELFEELDEAIHSLEESGDANALEEMKRALHTMKGGARLAGLPNLGELVHNYESYLEALSPGYLDENVFSQVHDYQDQMFRAVTAIKDYLGGSGIMAGPTPLAPDDAEGLSESEDAGASASSPAVASSNVVPFVGKPRQDDGDAVAESAVAAASPRMAAVVAKKSGPQEVVRVNSDLLEELVNLAGETSISRARMEEQVTEFRISLDEIDSTIDRLQEQLRRLDIETEAQILFRQEQMAVHDEDFDPLEMDRYSQLQQISRSLIESASDLSDLRSDLNDKVKDAETTLLQQSRINTTLQEGLMRSRMVPFSRLVPRLRRIVRQVASELGKKVSFELDNIEGELDRNVLERMVPPFEHMLRNAVDHGIESPDDRVAAGKSETGRIVLTLGREGSNVVIRLADDGRGIDLMRVRAKAIERGLMNENAELSDHDIMQFILHAGFSTAENVTQISGRGVGMDVVNAEIKQLGGDVTINSKWGHGTEFEIHLPFTLSVNRALMVNIGQDHYAIPLNSIEGIVRISPFELEHYYSNPDAEFEYANEKFKVRYLGSMLYPGRTSNLEGHALPLPIVLVRTAQHTMAMQVDGLMGSREVVVKSLGVQFSAVQGLSGATVMGDGSVVVILDPHALVRQEIARSDLMLDATKRAQLELLSEDEGVKADSSDVVRTVMVVDDSVTVRKVTTRFLEREGYNVITAKDGVDALRTLQEETPDLMLLDIEMPRMDGFEVAKNLRTSQRWKELPIIMITSRTGDKHREHALSLGVNRYMGKPYQEEALADAIEELLREIAR